MDLHKFCKIIYKRNKIFLLILLYISYLNMQNTQQITIELLLLLFNKPLAIGCYSHTRATVSILF